MEEKNVKIKLVGKANPNEDKNTKRLIEYLEQPHEWAVIDPFPGKNKTRRVKINSKDLEVFDEIKVIRTRKYFPDIKRKDDFKKLEELKLIKSIKPESIEVDLSIYKYKDQYIQKIPSSMSFSPDYRDEKNNYYNVYDIWNDKPFTWINNSEKVIFKNWLETWGLLVDWKKVEEHGKRN